MGGSVVVVMGISGTTIWEVETAEEEGALVWLSTVTAARATTTFLSS